MTTYSPAMEQTVARNGTWAKLPVIWEYSDYRVWFADTFRARKAIHSWYSYGVLAQRAGFKARDYLLRVIQGKKKLSQDGAERLADALDLPKGEKSYFLALVDYNQAKNDTQKNAAWERMQQQVARGRKENLPRKLTSIHREILSEWQHLALRSLLELRPDAGDCEALGLKLRPPMAAAMVERSLSLLEAGGLVERRDDGLLHATDKSLSVPPEVGAAAVRRFHRKCMQLASHALDDIPVEERNISGITLGISKRTYEHMCQRLSDIHQEFGRMAELDEASDRIYHLTLALFPMTIPMPLEND